MQASTNTQALFVPQGQPLANCLVTFLFEVFPQFIDGLFHQTAFLVFGIGFAVAFEATALVDMEQGAGKFGRRQWFIKPLATQHVGIQAFQGLALIGVFRKEPQPDQRGQ